MKQIINSEGFRLVSFDSGQPGLTVCISGGVHGDETCGVKAIEKLEKELLSKEKLLSGRVLTLIANQEAIKLKKRFVDFDLNRAFGNSSAIGHESNLAKNIASHLQGIDYLLDLHSTSAPTKPFCAGILTKRHIEIFKMIGVEYYTYGWEIHRGHSMLIDEVNRLGGIGVIVECGKTDDLKTDEIAYKSVKNLLQKFKIFPISNYQFSVENHIIIKIEQIIKAQSNDFTFTRHFSNLYETKADEIIAYDNKKSIHYKYPFLIVMPTVGSLKLGDEAFGIGIKNNFLI